MGPVASGFEYRRNPDITPHPKDHSKYDSMYGFPNGREEKVMIATEEELQAAKIPLKDRDFCAHLLLDFQGCRRKNFPWYAACHHEKHAYLTCEYEEFVDRMKDYEREKRLMHRDKRLGRSTA